MFKFAKLKKEKTMKNLQILRKNKKLKQSEIAETIGVATSTYSCWENNISEPDFDYLMKLADFFDVSIDVLLDRKELGSVTLKNSTQEAKQKWLSTLTKMQQSIIENVLKLNELQQYKVQAYMFGMLEA